MSGAARQTAVEIALAAAFAAILLSTSLVALGDPLRGTLAAVPLAVAALAALGRWAAGLGGRRLPREVVAAELLATAALTLIALGRHRFGLAVSDWFLVAGYVLVLAHHLAHLLPAWRPCLGQRLPRRPPAVFFFLPLVVYLALQPWMASQRPPDGDEPYYLLLAHSLAHELDVDLTDNYRRGDSLRFMERQLEPQRGDPRGPNGELLSRHNALLPLVLAPAYRLAGRWGAMAMMAAFAAAAAWMALRLARHYFPHRPGAALLAYGVFAFTPPLLLYSYQIWVEVPAALLLAVAIDGIWTFRSRRSQGTSQMAVVLASIALLPLLKLRFGLVAVPLLVLFWLRARPGRRATALAAAALGLALGGLLVYNALRFGNPLKMHGLNELSLLESSFSELARGAVGTFYDSAFGLFACAPLWLLLLPAAWLAWRRRSPLLADLAIVSLPYLLALWPRLEWYGGWSPPFRYPLVLLPLLALLLAPLLALRARPGLRALATALVALTLALTLVWIVFPGFTYNFADGRGHLLDRAGQQLGLDVARFFPSAVRPRAATWAWPLVSLLAIPIALWPGRRRAPASAAAGITLLFAAAALAVVAAGRWPTRIIEIEDAFVAKEGGVVSPPPWRRHRAFFRGGWAVPVGGRVTAPVVPGGERVTIRLWARFPSTQNARTLRVAAGDRLLATWAVPSEGWRVLELGPLDWPAGAPLVLLGPDPPSRNQERVIVDRAELRWE